MLDLLQLIFSRVQQALGTRNLSFSRVNRGRRLGMESLEFRRVMAATITTFEPTDSGFVFELSEEVQTQGLSLYDSENQAAGAADVTLRGASVGEISGSLMIEGTRGTFVATGGILEPDSYTVTLRSAADAFRDLADGELLDGENNGTLPSGNGTPGGNFVTTFAVSGNTDSLVVGLPDFARGPTQSVDLPAINGSSAPNGLPIRLGDADGVTSVSLTLTYDADLLDVTSVELGNDAPQGSEVSFNVVSPGVLNVAFIALAPMSSGQADIVNLIATVPEDAEYGKAHRLQLTSLSVNADAIAAIGDDAVHVVAFPGDANANRRYDSEDARLIARVGVNLDSGFVVTNPADASPSSDRTYPTIDPTIIGDVTGADSLSPLDASDVLRRVVGLSTPHIPDLPAAQAPTSISLSSTAVPEQSPVGTDVGILSSTDPDDGDQHSYALVAGSGDNDNASFTISGGVLKTAAVFDQSTKDTYQIRIRSTDSTGRTLERAFTITVADQNVAPTAITIDDATVAENAVVGTAVGSLSTTDSNAGDTHTYAIVSIDGSTTANTFTISGDTVRVGASLDFENKSTYAVRIRSTDQAGLSFEQVLTLSVTNVNEAPTELALSATEVADGATSGTVVGTLSTTDVDASDTHTYQLVSGTGSTDNASFTIVGNQLRVASTINFASRSAYSIRIRSTDAAGLSIVRVLQLTEANPNVAPTAITISSNSVAENVSSGTAVGTLSTTDSNSGDTHTYTLVSGSGSTDNASFAISGNQLRTATTLNFEAKTTYSVRVRSTDAGGLSFDRVLTISVTNVNESPTAITVSATEIADGATSGTVVGTLSTTDVDASDTHTYQLVSGTGSTDNASFTIVGNQLRVASTINFASRSAYSIRIRSTDAAGLSVERTLQLTEANPNVAPTAIAISSNTVAENVSSGTAVGTLSTTDSNSGDTHTYTLVSGSGSTDNASFAISGNQLRTAKTLNFEAKTTYSVRVRSTDSGGLSFERVLTISVTNVNETPSAIALNATEVADGATSGTVVATLSTTDVDASDNHTYTLVSGTGSTDNAAFTIAGNQLRTATTIDFTSRAEYSIRIRSTDAAGLSVERTVSITEANGNVAPTAITISSNAVAENVASGTTVGTLSTTDANAGDTHTYSLVSGTGSTDNGSFAISGTQLVTATSLDFESQPTHSLRVRSTDGDGLSFERVLTINVTNVNEAPTAVTLSATEVADGATSGTVVATLSTTDVDASDNHTYTLVSGTGSTDNAAFSIVGNQLRTAGNIDFTSRNEYSIRVRSTDTAGLSFERVFSITEANVNQAPTAIALSSREVADGAAVGTTIATLSSTDADASDTHTYALVSGTGSAGNPSFAIVGDQLRVAATINFASRNSYSIRIRSTDSGGQSLEQIFSITEANVAPTAIAISNNAIAENVSSGTAVGNLSTTDASSSDTHTYTLVTGTGDTDNASFAISGTQLVTTTALDFEGQPTATVRVRSTDSGGLSFEQVLAISITDVNEAPSAVTLSTSTVAEDEPSGTAVGTLGSTDPDVDTGFNYTLVSGNGDADNGSFAINGGQLVTTEVFDQAIKDLYTVRVRTTDGGGLSFDQVLNISVADENVAPTAVAISSSTIPINAAAATVVGTLSTTDANSVDSHSYRLVSGTGDTDNARFRIEGSDLVTVEATTGSTPTTLSVRVLSEDRYGLEVEQVLTLTVQT